MLSACLRNPCRPWQTPITLQLPLQARPAHLQPSRSPAPRPPAPRDMRHAPAAPMMPLLPSVRKRTEDDSGPQARPIRGQSLQRA